MQQGYIPPKQSEDNQPQRRRRAAAPQQYQPQSQPQYSQQPYQQPVQPDYKQQGYVQLGYQQSVAQAATLCPRCGSNRVNISMVQTAAFTRNRGRGILWRMGRFMLIFCTAGLWLLIGKSKGKSNTKIKSEKMAICQNCGNNWTLR